MNKLLKLTEHNYLPAYQIHHDGHAHPWSQRVYGDCLSGQYQAYGLCQDNVMLGQYVALFVLDEATLMDIGIALNARNQGFSHLLMTHFLEKCDERAIQSVWLEVRANNIAAIHLYHQYKFEVIERRINYYEKADGREDALIMKRTCTASG